MDLVKYADRLRAAIGETLSKDEATRVKGTTHLVRLHSELLFSTNMEEACKSPLSPHNPRVFCGELLIEAKRQAGDAPLHAIAVAMDRYLAVLGHGDDFGCFRTLMKDVLTALDENPGEKDADVEAAIAEALADAADPAIVAGEWGAAKEVPSMASCAQSNLRRIETVEELHKALHEKIQGLPGAEEVTPEDLVNLDAALASLNSCKHNPTTTCPECLTDLYHKSLELIRKVESDECSCGPNDECSRCKEKETA